MTTSPFLYVVFYVIFDFSISLILSILVRDNYCIFGTNVVTLQANHRNYM